mmetsp:Transcript_94647/g.187534  ORF Transcript_94647/g.187534 Transcript_94647/m.187534 type:complete len:101 (+) Transcript_94647:1047-1349(+)
MSPRVKLLQRHEEPLLHLFEHSGPSAWNVISELKPHNMSGFCLSFESTKALFGKFCLASEPPVPEKAKQVQLVCSIQTQYHPSASAVANQVVMSCGSGRQ